MDIDADLNVKCEDIDPKEMDKINDYYDSRYRSVMKRYGQNGYLLPENSSTFLSGLKRMKLRPTDIFVASFVKSDVVYIIILAYFPKLQDEFPNTLYSGTTWIQELVWLVINDLNFKKATSERLTERFSFLEIPIFCSQENIQSMSEDDNMRKGLELLFPPKMADIEAISSPRFFKTHLPMSLLPCRMLETCKVVYIARDPRDVAVSLYFHTRLAKTCAEGKTAKDIWDRLIKDQVPWAPYFDHVKEAWNLRDHPNLLFLFYEELSKDLAGAVRRVASFFGKHLCKKEITDLCEHLKFKNFKENTSVNLEEAKKFGYFDENEHFIRKGIVGDWIEHFDEEMKQQAERWMSENMQDTNLCFPY